MNNSCTIPEAIILIIQLVKCRCGKKRCPTNRCQCRISGLLCTDLCSCFDDSECENQHSEDDDDDCGEDDASDDAQSI